MHILSKIPHRAHPRGRRLLQLFPFPNIKDRKIPSRVHSSLGIESCLTISLQFIPGSSSDHKAASGNPIIWIACVNAKYIFNFLQWCHPQCAWSKDVTQNFYKCFPIVRNLYLQSNLLMSLLKFPVELLISYITLTFYHLYGSR